MKKDLTSIVDNRGNPITSSSTGGLKLGYSYSRSTKLNEYRWDYKKIKGLITSRTYTYLQKIKKGLFELSKYMPR